MTPGRDRTRLIAGFSHLLHEPHGQMRAAPEGTPYEGLALIADPIHSYIQFTVPGPHHPRETTEKALIDTAWVQRLRAIAQLQSARWVFPSAEHSRFQHSLGAMHVAGRFARHLYPSLREVAPDCPSQVYVEELLRTAALLHDIGHGPFCHFFDENFLAGLGLTHERISQELVCGDLAPIIRGLRRSPSGPFARGEELEPEHLACLIGKGPDGRAGRRPRWLTLLRPLLSGVYTADNLDYVLRDSYMCGVAIGPVDLDRLLHYSFFILTARDGQGHPSNALIGHFTITNPPR